MIDTKVGKRKRGLVNMFSMARLVPGRRCRRFLSEFVEDNSLAENREFLFTVKHCKQVALNRIIRQRMSARTSARVLGGKTVRPYRRGLLVHLNGNNEMHHEEMREPFGITTKGDRIAVASGDEVRIYDLANQRTEVFRNEWLAQVHSVCFSPDGKRLLVAATGYDTVLEFDIETAEMTWFWNGWDNGYAKCREGEMYRRKGRNIEQFDPASNQFIPWRRKSSKFGLPTGSTTTHLNNAQYFKSNNICITLFHQGKAIIIDRDTGEIIEVLGGLLNPHGFVPAWNDEKIVTDTRRGRAIFFDKDFLVKRSLVFDIDSIASQRQGLGEWLQNVLPLCDNLYGAIDIHRSCIWIIDMDRLRYRKIDVPESWAVQNIIVIEPSLVEKMKTPIAALPRSSHTILDSLGLTR